MPQRRYTELTNSSEEDLKRLTYDSTTHDDNVLPESEQHLSLWTAIRKWPRAAGWSIALTSTIILWGYDSALVGNVSAMPVFQEVFGELYDNKYIFPSIWLSVWSIASPMGLMAGAIISGYVGDIIGRKKMLFGSTALSATSVLIAYLSDTPANTDARRGLFSLAKMSQGICIGCLAATTQTYMSETVPGPLRASVLATFPIFQLAGQMIGSVVIQARMDIPGRVSYRVGLATMWVFGAVPLFLSIFLPESPAWLLRKGHLEKARRSHARIEGTKLDPSAALSFTRLQATIARERKEKSGLKEYLACFKADDRRRTLIVAFANIVPELFGLTLIGGAPYFFQTIGISHSMSNMFFMVGILLALVANITSLWTLTKLGRRTLLFWSLLVVTMLWGVTAVIGTATTSVVMQWSTAIGLILVTFCASLGCWPVSYVIAAESSSLRLRAKTQGIGWFVSGAYSMTMGFVLPYIYNTDAGNLGAKTGFVMMGFAGLATVVTWFLVPELKDRTAEEIDRMFELGLSARQFSKWDGVSEKMISDV